MPKRIGHLYEKALDKDYIRAIIHRAALHREKRPDIARVLKHLDSCVNRIYSMLLNDSYTPHKPKVVMIFDESSQKERKIQMLPFFPDCIIQWIAVDLLMPVLRRGMDPYCSSSVPRRGGNHIYKKLKYMVRRNVRNARYCVQMDVHHYYDNISIDILMQMLRRKCKDERLLRLVERILRSSAPEEGNGIAIGFYLNQWMANFYLENIDRMVHRGKSIKCYVRHMDNITFLDPNRRKLKRKMWEIIERVKEIGLTIKHDFQLFPLTESRKKATARNQRQQMRSPYSKPLLPYSRDVRAVGYRFFGTGRIMLRKRNWLKLRRQITRVRAYGTGLSPRMARSFMSRFGNIKHVSSFRIFADYIKDIDFSIVRRRAAA